MRLKVDRRGADRHPQALHHVAGAGWGGADETSCRGGQIDRAGRGRGDPGVGPLKIHRGVVAAGDGAEDEAMRLLAGGGGIGLARLGAGGAVDVDEVAGGQILTGGDDGRVRAHPDRQHGGVDFARAVELDDLGGIPRPGRADGGIEHRRGDDAAGRHLDDLVGGAAGGRIEDGVVQDAGGIERRHAVGVTRPGAGGERGLLGQDAGVVFDELLGGCGTH